MNETRTAPEDDMSRDARRPVGYEPRRDDKGRPVPESMSDRELLIETLAHMRVMYDAITALGSNPMLAAFMPPALRK